MIYWFIQLYGWFSKTLCLVKEARYKQPSNFIFMILLHRQKYMTRNKPIVAMYWHYGKSWLSRVRQIFLWMFIFEREREREHEQGRGRERWKHRIWSRPQTLYWQLSVWVGFKLVNHEITIWAEVGRPTDWAIQAPQESGKYFGVMELFYILAVGDYFCIDLKIVQFSLCNVYLNKLVMSWIMSPQNS